ncbi:sensor histidine kinase [Candidatus Reidiella endopervernicosa]|uniref:histidine kinase n=1 Tax=Candidatus Reidiella endopervernicosa TaxID=2738883 RepID=A0A6N0HZD5_9GAMM|nr:ATP-binding protein [Candidatus Reidiella endopervernicosa]QKQ27516.1 hypothetical protein HUE57_15420 [Candidatus Reidiella endopervernicosa]
MPNKSASLNLGSGQSRDHSRRRTPHAATIVRSEEDTWKPLYLFNLYRSALSGLLLILFVTGLGPSLLGKSDPLLYLITTVIYLLFCMGALITTYLKKPRFNIQVYLQLTVDIFAITLIMHASGGISSGLAMLLIVSLAGGSLLMSGYIAIFFAAVTSTVVLFEQVYAELTNAFTTTAYTQAGMLGVAFFATTIVLHLLAARVSETEALAHRRGIDLANLAQLNDYVIQHMESGALVVDIEGSIRLINSTARTMLGTSAQIESLRLSTINPDLSRELMRWRKDRSAVAEALRIGETTLEIRPRFIPLGRREEDTGTLIYLDDMAVLSQRAQQMKLAALGQLTASIAHEIRNPLGAISHAGQLLAESPELDKGDSRFIEIILEQSGRVNEIIENVLQISRRDPSFPESIELHSWLRNFFDEYCEHGRAHDETLKLEIEPQETQIEFDPTQLRQIISNLVDNAIRHGEPNANGTRLHVRGGLLDESDTPYLEVIDFGGGIDEAIAENIFDPFFTTRSSGTGLGLYLAKELCEMNGARLEHRRAESGGASFRILFSTPTTAG